MELLYIWVRKYGCFNDAGFNFSPKHKFVFDSDNSILEYHQTENTVENFFCNEENRNTKKARILNISAIVGNNGSGKSTLLEIIFRNLVHGEGGISIEAVFIIYSKEDNKIKFYYNYKLEEEHPKRIFLKSNSFLDLFNFASNKPYELKNELGIDEISKGVLFIKDLEDTHFIYLSNTFDSRYNDYTKKGNISDLSTMGLIRGNSKLNTEMRFTGILQDIHSNYFYSEFNNQINFITQYKNHYEQYIPFNLPNKVYAYFRNFDTIKNEISKRIDDSEISEKIEVIYNNYKENNLSPNNIFKCNIAKRLIIMLLNDFMNEPIGNERHNLLYSEVESALKSIKLIKDTWRYTFNLLEQIQLNLSLADNPSYIFVKKYLDFMSWIDLHIKEIGYFEDIHHNNTFIIPTFEEVLDNQKYVGIQEFFYQYHKTAGIADYLNFSWELSTGESTLFSLFSRLFSITKELSEGQGYYLIGNRSNNNYFKKAIILVDEADLTFHPEWQQKYIKAIVSFIEDIYQECEIQIIITTHSPIILSDIPKNNVIFLKAKNNQVNVDDNFKHSETFGSNITTLFYDSFFMEKGSIGQFAKEKINNVIKAINSLDVGFESNSLPYLINVVIGRDLRRRIQIIGDDILRDKLNGMLNMKLNLLLDIPNKINEIDERIKKLEIEKRRLKGENL
ncbi:hypothetical protein DP73_21040 [Desulfosporosinus sp. HMP52]|uniref:AAA family ATPase n=1 Tax=Desulfosporosinus sp. HMP52 TaxID=1487923 RepID=UPI00051F88F3|nr:AAA family ATPase [Desulfosporosinus sp. HMP52]KGK81925.1 hypothetical protein DP73_21040 [Desulfosporosinus sp. HMP52]